MTTSLSVRFFDFAYVRSSSAVAESNLSNIISMIAVGFVPGLMRYVAGYR